jgi:hypothetical protein
LEQLEGVVAKSHYVLVWEQTSDSQVVVEGG